MSTPAGRKADFLPKSVLPSVTFSFLKTLTFYQPKYQV